jgi:hypothetical protein
MIKDISYLTLNSLEILVKMENKIMKFSYILIQIKHAYLS